MRGRSHSTRREGGGLRAAVARSAFTWSDQTEAHRPWLDAIHAALPRDRVVVLDSTQLAYSAHHYVPASTSRSWIAPYGFGTLGNAVPMAIGAKLGAPDRAVIAIAGDGGILFTISELATAVDLELTLPIIVWDNAGYGEIRDWFDRAGAPRVGTETTAHDLQTIARGFGCRTSQPQSPEEPRRSVVDALAHAGPTVIHIRAPGLQRV